MQQTDARPVGDLLLRAKPTSDDYIMWLTTDIYYIVTRMVDLLNYDPSGLIASEWITSGVSDWFSWLVQIWRSDRDSQQEIDEASIAFECK